MKLPFESWATRDKFTFFFCGSALLIIAIVYMNLHLSNPRITSKQDLEFFNGTLIEHHYYHSWRGGRDCWFKIRGCSDDFVIDGNNLKAFDIQDLKIFLMGIQ